MKIKISKKSGTAGSLILCLAISIFQPAGAISLTNEMEKGRLELEKYQERVKTNLINRARVAGTKVAEKVLDDLFKKGIKNLGLEKVVSGFLGTSGVAFGGILAGALVGSVLPNPEHNELLERFDKIDAGIENLLKKIDSSTLELKKHITFSFDLNRFETAKGKLRLGLLYFDDFSGKNMLGDLLKAKEFLRSAIEDFKIVSSNGFPMSIDGLQLAQSTQASVEKTLVQFLRANPSALIAGRMGDPLGTLRTLRANAINNTKNFIDLAKIDFEANLAQRIAIKELFIRGPHELPGWICDIFADGESVLTIAKPWQPNSPITAISKRDGLVVPAGWIECGASVEIVKGYLRASFQKSVIEPQLEIIQSWQKFDFNSVIGIKVQGNLPEEGFSRDLIISVPDSFAFGEPVSILAEITNTSIYEWNPQNGVYFGYFAEQIPNGANRQETRLENPKIVYPGQTEQIRQSFSLATSGIYEVHLDMLQEGVSWAHFTRYGAYKMPKFNCVDATKRCTRIF